MKQKKQKNKMNGKHRRHNDILWKGMLEEVFDDLLRFVFPRAERIFDLERGFDFLDKELGDRLTGKNNTMGIIEQVKQMKLDEARAEARKEGRKEEKAQVVKRLLARGYSVKEITVVAGVTVGFVSQVRAASKVK